MSKKKKDKNKDKSKDNNKRKARDKTEAGNDQSDGSLPAGAAVGMKIAFALVAVVMVVVGLYLLRENVRSSSTMPAGESACVHFDDLPDWLPAETTAKIVADIQSAIKGKSVLDGYLAKDVSDAAARNPWISKVHEVTPQKDGTILVRADFRRPVALVIFRPMAPGDIRVVDSDGVVLPPLPRRWNFVRILEITTDPPPVGEKWDSKPLADALKLLNLIKDKPYRSLINPIEIGIIDTQTHLVMHASAGGGRGARIFFGRFPVNDLDHCVSPAVKIAGLDRIFSAHGGRFDGIREIDLQYDEPHYRLY